MASTSSGTVNSPASQKRRDMSRSSALSSSSPAPARGSSAIPQIGQVPGASRTISGCIGQVHSALAAGRGDTASSAIPHFGQEPGWSTRTSGCIGQVYAPLLGAVADGGACCSAERYLDGSLAKRSRQRAL